MITDAHNHLHQLTPPTLEGTGIDLASVCGTSPADWETVLGLAAAEPRLVAAIGLHPWDIGRGWEASLDALGPLLETHPGAAVGEIGLDRTRRSPPFDTQVPVLLRQLETANSFGRPAVLHCVRAWGKLCDLLESAPLPGRGFLLHSYAGPAGMVPRFAVLGARFSFSDAPPAELLDQVPPDRLLTESDATAANGRSPAHAAAVARSIAETLAEPAEATAARITDNFWALFGAAPGAA